MTDQRGEDAQAAMQYLIWALERIEVMGNHKAAHHARIALEALRQGLAGQIDDRDPSSAH